MYGLEDREERITELLDRLELSHRRYDVVRTFSKGMRQRLAIARAILHRPRVLLLDEPHSGLDPRAVDILDGLLAEIRAEHTFVMVTHHIQKGLELATQLMIVDGGKIVWEHDAGVDPRDLQRRLPRARPGRLGAVMGGREERGLMGRRQFMAILRKDLIRELRTREMLVEHVPLRHARPGDLPLRLRRRRGHRPDATSPAACSG